MKNDIIIPCICMTCGVRNDLNNPTESGYCINDHDAWLEYSDVVEETEWFELMVKKTGLTPLGLREKFMDTSVKQLEFKSARLKRNKITTMKQITSNEAYAVRNEQRKQLEETINYLLAGFTLIYGLKELNSTDTGNVWKITAARFIPPSAVVDVVHYDGTAGELLITDERLTNDDLIYLLACIEEELIVKED